MKAYLIDTSVIINYLRHKESTVETINNLSGELTSSYICLAELYEGISRVREKEKAEKVVLDFFVGLDRTYSLDEDIAKHFGQIKANLKMKGQVIEDLDILLAVTCIAKGLTLITSNPKHFSRVANLEILTVN
ncbi:type II toxin-antitoxin system VapC family toxin [Candidatus Daviesbacteria bacterium]|nr:type II toxin-antitoxin system VapC family toxin [Candidatus Daviesbacteria bacterium]